MDWQQIAALGIVALTAALMARGWWARRRPGRKTAGGCGTCCGAAGVPGPGRTASPTLILKARKGQKPYFIERPPPNAARPPPP